MGWVQHWETAQPCRFSPSQPRAWGEAMPWLGRIIWSLSPSPSAKGPAPAFSNSLLHCAAQPGSPCPRPPGRSLMCCPSNQQVFPQIVIASTVVVSMVGLALHHQLARHVSDYLLGKTELQQLRPGALSPADPL